MLGNIIGGFIVIVIGTTLAPTIANTITGGVSPTNASGGAITSNITGASATVLGLTTLFYNLSIATSAIGVATQGLRNAGLM